MARIFTKNQITIPVAALEEVGLRAGEQVTVEPVGDGELRIRRATKTFDETFGALTGSYPDGYLQALDAEDGHPISLPDASCLATAKHTGSTITSFDQKMIRAAAREQISAH